MKTRKLLSIIASFLLVMGTLNFMAVSVSHKAYAYGTPSWWSGTCDDNHYYAGTGVHSFALGSSYQGIIACGPMPDNGGPDYQVSIGGFGENEWECIELAFRYMNIAFGQGAYSAFGKDVVNNYHSHYSNGPLVPMTNGSAAYPPAAGDIISFYNPNSSSDPGHAAVIQSVGLDGSGNVNSVTLLEQNNKYDSSGGGVTLSVTHGGNGWSIAQMSSNRVVENWLHYPQGHLAITSGITPTPTSMAQIGGSFSATYYLTNNGETGSTIQYNQLKMVLTGPNNYNSVLRYDGGNTLAQGAGGTITYSTSSFLSGCTSCIAGTYTITADWQDMNNNWRTLDTGGGTNPQTVTVFKASPVSSIKRVNSTSTNGTIEIFSINSQGNVYANSECSSCQGGWTGWSSLGLPGTQFTGKVSATINSAAQVTIFARDTSGNIWFNSECNSNSGCPSGWAWEGWYELPNFQSPYDPTAFDYDSNNDMEVMVNGSDQTVSYNYYNGSWSGWNHISNAKAFATNVQVGIYQSSSTNIFALDSSGTIWGSWTSYGNPNGWSSWNNFGSVFYTNASPIRYDSAGDLDLFAQSNLNVVGNDPVVSGSWQGFSQTTANPSGISFAGMIAGGIDPGNNAEIFTRDTSTGAIWHQWGLPGSWSAWQSLGGHAVADPAVTAHSDKTLDVFLFNNDGSIWYNQQCNCNPTWPGWVSLGPIW